MRAVEAAIDLPVNNRRKTDSRAKRQHHDGLGALVRTNAKYELSMILKESTRLHAEGMSAAAFRHGPLEMAGKNVLVLIFEGDADISEMHRRLANDIVRGGGNAMLIADF